ARSRPRRSPRRFAWRRRILGARSAPSPPSRSPLSRAIEMGLEETLSWPFFDDGHRRFAESLARSADATLSALPPETLDAACRAAARAHARRLPRAGEGGRGGRFRRGGGARRARRPPPRARRAHALPCPRHLGVPRWTFGLRLRHAGLGHSLDLAVRLGGAQ